MLLQFGSEYYAKMLVVVAAPIRTWPCIFKRIATNRVDFPALYTANIYLGQCVRHPLVEVDYNFLLQHAVLYHLTTKRGIDVKLGICVEGRVDNRFANTNTLVCKQFIRDLDNCLLIGSHGDGGPYTKSEVCQRRGVQLQLAH